jgi:hypothetical protein
MKRQQRFLARARAELLLGVLVFSATGCAVTLGERMALTTENTAIPLEPIGRVEGRDCASVIFVIPTGRTRIDQAIDDALLRAPGSIALRDVQIKHHWIFFLPPFYVRACIEVTGEAMKPLEVPHEE